MPLVSHSTSNTRSKLERAKIGAKESLSLMASRALWVAFVHSNLPFFYAFGQGIHNDAKVFNELTVERGQPIEASHFYDGGGSRPTLDSLNFRFINLNSLNEHNIAKKYNLRNE